VLDHRSEKSREGKQAASDVLDRAIAVSRQLAAADASVARAIEAIVTDDDGQPALWPG
jgi:hypothetical protein